MWQFSTSTFTAIRLAFSLTRTWPVPPCSFVSRYSQTSAASRQRKHWFAAATRGKPFLSNIWGRLRRFSSPSVDFVELFCPWMPREQCCGLNFYFSRIYPHLPRSQLCSRTHSQNANPANFLHLVIPLAAHVCCLVELIAPFFNFQPNRWLYWFPSGCIYANVHPGWTEMTVSPLRPERDLGLASLPLHCLWSHSGLLGQLLIVYMLCVFACVCLRQGEIERPLMSGQRASGPGSRPGGEGEGSGSKLWEVTHKNTWEHGSTVWCHDTAAAHTHTD